MHVRNMHTDKYKEFKKNFAELKKTAIVKDSKTKLVELPNTLKEVAPNILKSENLILFGRMRCSYFLIPDRFKQKILPHFNEIMNEILEEKLEGERT